MNINVICATKNHFFRFAMSKIIKDAISGNVTVKYLDEFNCCNIKKADFIIANASQWKFYMCQPSYRYRKPGALIIIYSKEQSDFNITKLPLCYQSSTFFSRNSSVLEVSQIIREHWFLARENDRGHFSSDCLRCNFSHVTPQELRVISLLRSGLNTEISAGVLNLSKKTIYTHKHNIIKRFSLSGEIELHTFINELSLIELYTGILKPINDKF